MFNIAEEIKKRVLPSTIIGKRVKLKKNGHNFSGLCPFHNEKTASFTVNDDKGFYHCFGCNAGGDVINFVMEIDKIDFLSACEYLAKITGIQWNKDENISSEDRAKNVNINNVLQAASDWFHTQLMSSRGYHVREYLHKRQIDNRQIEHFNLGYAPRSSDSLLQHLKKSGYSIDLIRESGVASINSHQEIFDYFRERLIFPIFNNKNQIIAFGGRSLDKSMPKYLNSPENILFKKSEVLYGENLAKKAAIKLEELIVVEGYIDLIALNRVGIEQVVATLGTAVTKQHLLNLWKYVNEPTMCLDGDVSGQKAMLKVTELALPLISEEKSIKFCILPSGFDPDDVINHFGKEYFLDLLKEAVPLSEIIWKNELSKVKSTTPEQISALEKRLYNIASSVVNPTVKRNYQDYFRQKVWNNFKSKGESAKYKPSKNISNNQFYVPYSKKINIINRLENILLAQIIDFPELLEHSEIYEEVLRINFSDPINNEIRDNILESKLKQNVSFTESLNDAGFSKEVEFLCGKNSIFSDKLSKLSHDELEQKWNLCFKKYTLALLNQEYMVSVRQLTEEAQNKAQSLYEQIVILEKEIQRLEYNFSELNDN